MEHERPHRTISTVEPGYADAAAGHQSASKHSAIHAPPPQFLINWEERRPRLAMELFAEFVGVFFYVYSGVGATMSFNLTSLAGQAGYGSLLNIALAYGFGIAFGILCTASTSGAHLSPGFTLVFAMYKGFPWRKVPMYICAQIAGGFVAALMVYAQYQQTAREVLLLLESVGKAEINFTPAGPAGALAIFIRPGVSLGLTFLNETMCTIFIAVLVFSVLDPSNFFVSFGGAPFIIGLSYTVIILGFAVGGVTLNTARDLGGRFACAVIYGRQAFPAKFSALSALTNIFGTIIGATIQIFLLSDHRRAKVNVPPQLPGEAEGRPSPHRLSNATAYHGALGGGAGTVSDVRMDMDKV